MCLAAVSQFHGWVFKHWACVYTVKQGGASCILFVGSIDTEYFIWKMFVEFPSTIHFQGVCSYIVVLDLDILVLKKHLEFFQRIQDSVVCGMDRCQMTSLQRPTQPVGLFFHCVWQWKISSRLNGFLTKIIMYNNVAKISMRPDCKLEVNTRRKRTICYWISPDLVN